MLENYNAYEYVTYNIKFIIVDMLHAICHKYAKLNFKQIKSTRKCMPFFWYTTSLYLLFLNVIQDKLIGVVFKWSLCICVCSLMRPLRSPECLASNTHDSTFYRKLSSALFHIQGQELISLSFLHKRMQCKEEIETLLKKRIY